MSNKPDTSSKVRSRVKTACPEGLQVYLDLVNLFPPVEKLREFAIPLFPSKNRLFRLNHVETTDDREERIKWYIDVNLIGMELTKFLESEGVKYTLQFFGGEQYFKESHRLSNMLEESQDLLENLASDVSFERDISARAQLPSRLAERNERMEAFLLHGSNAVQIWVEKYNVVRRLKILLKRIADIGRNFREADTNKTIAHGSLLSLRHLAPDLRIDEDGIIRRNEVPAIVALIGVDARRIKLCKVCRAFFWAQRFDRKCCSERCANTYNKRLSRERKQSEGSSYQTAARRKVAKRAI